MFKPPLNQIEKLLDHCNKLIENNNGYTRVYNDRNNKNIIDKKTWVFCTKYAELLTRANSILISEFLQKFKNINPSLFEIGDIDYSLNIKGDRGDLFYYYNKTPYIINVKSCPLDLYQNIKNKLKTQNKTSFMGLASIIIRKDIIPLKEELRELWGNEDFINKVIFDIYDNCELNIHDLQFKYQITDK